jgi:hypothetical protein
MLHVVINAVVHGTQVGSEGIIAILIGLVH